MNIKDLATSDEIKEINVTLQSKVQYVPTFTMLGIQFYRIVGPSGHPHLHSDMSKDGMIEWKVIALALVVSVFVNHPEYFLYLYHGHVALMQTGVC
jgi:hypothetical protein